MLPRSHFSSSKAFWLFEVLYTINLDSCILHFFQHYQRDIVRGVEGYIVTGSKQVEIGRLFNLECWLKVSYNVCYIRRFSGRIFHSFIVPQGRNCLRIAGNVVQKTHVQMVTSWLGRHSAMAVLVHRWRKSVGICWRLLVHRFVSLIFHSKC